MQTICADQGRVVATQNLLAMVNDAIIHDKLNEPVLGEFNSIGNVAIIHDKINEPVLGEFNSIGNVTLLQSSLTKSTNLP